MLWQLKFLEEFDPLTTEQLLILRRASSGALTTQSTQTIGGDRRAGDVAARTRSSDTSPSSAIDFVRVIRRPEKPRR
jgi:hypothetical protein